MCLFLDSVIIFEPFSGFLYRNLFYLRLARAVFERTSIVMPSVVGSNGHCRSWYTRQELTSLFFSKTDGFHPGKTLISSDRLLSVQQVTLANGNYEKFILCC